MTRELLNEIENDYWNEKASPIDMAEVFDLAIKALEQEQTTNNDLVVDCISRAEVLNLIYDYKENHSENRKEYPINYGTLLDMIRWIRKLPSVTPQPMVVSIAEGKIDEDKFKELASRAVLTVTPQEPQIFKWCDTCKEYDQENHCCHRWSKAIRDTVEEMKQEQEPRWIPVSERLPKWGEEVLTIDNDGNYEINHIIDDDINEWFYDGVVAWMPLPQPYERQESEDKE